MGNRFQGGICHGAMPPLHRYFGNPLLTILGRFFFCSSRSNWSCRLRGFERRAILALDLQASGMEFALEMLVKATTNKLRIAEGPTTLSHDGRGRPPYLWSWRNRWRSLRFYLLFSPRWLFLYPGTAMLLTGALVMAWLLLEPLVIGGVGFDIHTLLYAAVGGDRRRAVGPVLDIHQDLRYARRYRAPRSLVLLGHSHSSGAPRVWTDRGGRPASHRPAADSCPSLLLSVLRLGPPRYLTGDSLCRPSALATFLPPDRLRPLLFQPPGPPPRLEQRSGSGAKSSRPRRIRLGSTELPISGPLPPQPPCG